MKALVIVAHPDDETIWTGGVILRHPEWKWTILSLCRSNDPDRAPRFRAAVNEFGAFGLMSDLDDSPCLSPLSVDLTEITSRILTLLPSTKYDFILTHGRRGEYTRHERHEQAHNAVLRLIARGNLTGRLVFFAYEDGGGSYPPRPSPDADLVAPLNDREFSRKAQIVSRIYGFGEGSFEYSACGRVEAFRAFNRTKPLSEMWPLEGPNVRRGDTIAYSTDV